MSVGPFGLGKLGVGAFSPVLFGLLTEHVINEWRRLARSQSVCRDYTRFPMSLVTMVDVWSGSS